MLTRLSLTAAARGCSVSYPIEHYIWNKTKDYLTASVEKQVWKQLWTSGRRQIWHQVWEQARGALQQEHA